MTVERLIDDWDMQVWEIPNVKNNHPEKVEHPCQFPVELAERCILALTNQNDVVYISREKTMVGRRLYSPPILNTLFKTGVLLSWMA